MSEHGAYMTGHTFTGHTAACAAGLAVQHIVAARSAFGTRPQRRRRHFKMPFVRALGKYRRSRRRSRAAGFSSASNWFATAAPGCRFLPSGRSVSTLARAAFADGLICYPCSGNVDGAAGDTVIIAPPYNASDGELEEIVTKLARAVGSALSGA